MLVQLCVFQPSAALLTFGTPSCLLTITPLLTPVPATPPAERAGASAQGIG